MGKEVELRVKFTFESDAAAEDAVSPIEERLREPNKVHVRAIVDQPRLTGAEIAAAVAVTALIVGSAADVVKQLRRFVEEARGLQGALRAESASIQVGARQVPVADLTDEDMAELMKE
jgi:hypothetical protein